MNVAVYSGSFNPLHKGHEAIIRFLTREAGFDIVYLVVTPQNPFKDRHSLPAGKDRYNAALDALSRHPDLKVKACDIELKMLPPQYTINTLDALKRLEPENNFTLVIGADNLANFMGWRYHERILLKIVPKLKGSVRAASRTEPFSLPWGTPFCFAKRSHGTRTPSVALRLPPHAVRQFVSGACPSRALI